MTAQRGPLAEALADLGGQGVAEVLSEGPEHLDEEPTLGRGIVEVLGDGDQGDVGLGQRFEVTRRFRSGPRCGPRRAPRASVEGGGV